MKLCRVHIHIILDSVSLNFRGSWNGCCLFLPWYTIVSWRKWWCDWMWWVDWVDEIGIPKFILIFHPTTELVKLASTYLHLSQVSWVLASSYDPNLVGYLLIAWWNEVKPSMGYGMIQAKNNGLAHYLSKKLNKKWSNLFLLPILYLWLLKLTQQKVL